MFERCTGLMGSTAPGQQVTRDNVHHLPPGSVVRLPEGDILIHLHDDLWYWRSGCAWCYDRVERFYIYLPGELCHHP